MNNEKVPPTSGTPLMNNAYNAPYPQAGMGGNYPLPPPYGTAPQPYPAAGPQAYPPGGQQAPVIVAAPVHTTVVVGVQWRDTPVATVCPHCSHNITTRLAYVTGGLTWLIFAMLCLFGCWLGCCLIPFFVDSCKDVDHICPNCNVVIYKYKRL